MAQSPTWSEHTHTQCTIRTLVNGENVINCAIDNDWNPTATTRTTDVSKSRRRREEADGLDGQSPSKVSAAVAGKAVQLLARRRRSSRSRGDSRSLSSDSRTACRAAKDTGGVGSMLEHERDVVSTTRSDPAATAFTASVRRCSEPHSKDNHRSTFRHFDLIVSYFSSGSSLVTSADSQCQRRTSHHHLCLLLWNKLFKGFVFGRRRRYRLPRFFIPSFLNMYIRMTTLVLIVSTVLRTTEACSSRSTPKPRPPSPTMRPNITFPTFACPQAYATWYCLNGATCFTVEISESILYNCVCAEGFTGPRCEFKDLDGSYLPSREKVMIEKASIAGGVTIAVLLMVIISIAFYIYSRRRKKAMSCDQIDSAPQPRPFTTVKKRKSEMHRSLNDNTDVEAGINIQRVHSSSTHLPNDLSISSPESQL